MTTQTYIQLPISNTIKKNALLKAENLGFSSLQDLLRSFLINFVNNSNSLYINEKNKWDNLNKKQQALLDKRFQEIKQAEKKGEVFTSSSPDEIMHTLLNYKIDS